MDKTIHVYIPKKIVILYGVMAVALIPWIFNLAKSLPTRHIAEHWGQVWVGFDLMMLVLIGLTVYFALKRQLWAVLSATALATLFIMDTWFDILTAKPGHEEHIAILSGCLEVLLAIFTLRLVYHVVRYTTPQQDHIRLTSDKKHRKHQ